MIKHSKNNECDNSTREYLRFSNDTYSKCGNYTNVVHHKDGKRYDHSLDNLVPLCVSCHTKLHKNGLDR